MRYGVAQGHWAIRATGKRRESGESSGVNLVRATITRGIGMHNTHKSEERERL